MMQYNATHSAARDENSCTYLVAQPPLPLGRRGDPAPPARQRRLVEEAVVRDAHQGGGRPGRGPYVRGDLLAIVPGRRRRRPPPCCSAAMARRRGRKGLRRLAAEGAGGLHVRMLPDDLLAYLPRDLVYVLGGIEAIPMNIRTDLQSIKGFDPVALSRSSGSIQGVAHSVRGSGVSPLVSFRFTRSLRVVVCLLLVTAVVG